ncbi:methyltransferase, partial [Neisseria meningitidis]|nr:methyltransferase [Neisseria meningitidis]
MNHQDARWQVHRHLAEYADQRLTLVRIRTCKQDILGRVADE